MAKDEQFIKLPAKAIYHINFEADSHRRIVIFDVGRAGETSDGYHTFDELYMHRMALTAALFTMNRRHAWKSKQHDAEGDPMFEGFFIVGMDLPDGRQISYHYKLQYWDLFNGVPEVAHAPAWDGHTPHDVIDRLLAFADINPTPKPPKETPSS